MMNLMLKVKKEDGAESINITNNDQNKNYLSER